MDRSLVEGNPHSVVEGMIIGAYAIGSHTGYVYVRHEYPLAVKNLTLALQHARQHGDDHGFRGDHRVRGQLHRCGHRRHQHQRGGRGGRGCGQRRELCRVHRVGADHVRRRLQRQRW
jgi:hypothetical protein